MTGTACIDALKALGEETRLRMIPLLYKKPLTVSEISDRLKVTPYNVSKHLKIMREAGLLDAEKHGRERLYCIPKKLKHKGANSVLELGCCSFRLDQLPK